MSEFVAVLDLADLLRPRIQCQACGATVTFRLSDGGMIPRSCPTNGCRSRWDGFGQEHLVGQAQQLLALVTSWNSIPGDAKPFELRFEVSPALFSATKGK